MINIYKEELLEHYYHPKNFGKIDGADFCGEAHNPFCGDMIKIYLKKGKNHLMVKFVGEGCVISVAAASLLTDYLTGLEGIDQINALKPGRFLKLLGANLTPIRKKCALTSYWALKKAILSPR